MLPKMLPKLPKLPNPLGFPDPAGITDIINIKQEKYLFKGGYGYLKYFKTIKDAKIHAKKRYKHLKNIGLSHLASEVTIWEQNKYTTDYDKLRWRWMPGKGVLYP
jgi:hypothetical protein